jgi:hypothetical protein
MIKRDEVLGLRDHCFTNRDRLFEERAIGMSISRALFDDMIPASPRCIIEQDSLKAMIILHRPIARRCQTGQYFTRQPQPALFKRGAFGQRMLPAEIINFASTVCFEQGCHGRTAHNFLVRAITLISSSAKRVVRNVASKQGKRSRLL